MLAPKSGIGQHFHNTMEEMFVILNGEAQFTIDGRTSVIKGPAGAPCRMGHSHAVYNATDQPMEWMNIAVATIKGKYDNFDLGDPRVDVALDPIPQFISMKLYIATCCGRRRRFTKARALCSIDACCRPKYSSLRGLTWTTCCRRRGHPSARTSTPGSKNCTTLWMAKARFRVNDETAPVKKGDAIVMASQDVLSFENAGGAPLELLVVAAAMEKGKIDSVNVK